MHHLLESPGELVTGYCAQPEVIICAPTRELVMQIHEVACKYAYSSVLKICLHYGGASSMHFNRQLEVSLTVMFFVFFAFSRVQMESAFFGSQSALTRLIALGWHLVLATNFTSGCPSHSTFANSLARKIQAGILPSTCCPAARLKLTVMLFICLYPEIPWLWSFNLESATRRMQSLVNLIWKKKFPIHYDASSFLLNRKAVTSWWPRWAVSRTF
jgi:Superfamily II DNA and RNA helicases